MGHEFRPQNEKSLSLGWNGYRIRVIFQRHLSTFYLIAVLSHVASKTWTKQKRFAWLNWHRIKQLLNEVAKTISLQYNCAIGQSKLNLHALMTIRYRSACVKNILLNPYRQMSANDYCAQQLTRATTLLHVSSKSFVKTQRRCVVLCCVKSQQWNGVFWNADPTSHTTEVTVLTCIGTGRLISRMSHNSFLIGRTTSSGWSLYT